MTPRRLVLSLVVVAALLVTACGNPGTPTSFEDQDGRVVTNFIEGCREEGKNEDIDPDVRDNIEQVCDCAILEIRTTLTFEEFKDLDDDLRSDINSDLPNPVSTIMRNCIRQVAGV